MNRNGGFQTKKKRQQEIRPVKCALCETKECYQGKDCLSIATDIEKKYIRSDLDILKAAADIEAQYYIKKTRLEELILFAERMDYKKIGIAFCIGLEKEAKLIHTILEKKFEVYSVCCKICGIDKSAFRLPRVHNENTGIEAICNPVGQATVLNNIKTDLNVILGLCMGHDILFTKHSTAPVTTLAVKDRVLAHNPLGAIYSNYYLKRFLDTVENK